MPGPTNDEVREKLSELKRQALEIGMEDIDWRNVAKATGKPTDYYNNSEDNRRKWLEGFKDELDKKVLEASMEATKGNLTGGVRGGKKENREEWGAFEWLIEFRAEKDQFLKKGERKTKLNALVKEIEILLPRAVPENVHSRE